MSESIFYIDPMSYNNLALYDTALLENHPSQHTVYFFCNAKFSTAQVKGVKLCKVFHYSDQPKAWQPFSYLLSMLQLAYYAFKIKPKVLHVQWFKLPALDYLFYRLLKRLIPSLHMLHTAHNVLPHKPRQSDLKNYTKLYQLSDAIILHTAGSRDELQHMIGKDAHTQLHIIPHGILAYPITASEVDSKIAALKLQQHIGGKLVFSSLGEQSYYKGIDLLVNAWLDTPTLRNSTKSLLFIAGKGEIPRLDELQSTPNVVINNSYVDDVTFLSYLKVTDVVLLPYRRISQSGLLLTAINYEKPIIAAAVGGLKDPFTQSTMGWQIQPNDSDALRDAILYLIHHPAEVKKVQEDKATWAHLKQQYSWEAIQQQTFDLYDSYIPTTT